jgi:MFS family permease
LMTSISTTYYQVILAQGVCVGLGGGFLFIPSVAIIATYFRKRRSFAIGLAASGSSIGENHHSCLNILS